MERYDVSFVWYIECHVRTTSSDYRKKTLHFFFNNFCEIRAFEHEDEYLFCCLEGVTL